MSSQSLTLRRHGVRFLSGMSRTALAAMAMATLLVASCSDKGDSGQESSKTQADVRSLAQRVEDAQKEVDRARQELNRITGGAKVRSNDRQAVQALRRLKDAERALRDCRRRLEDQQEAIEEAARQERKKERKAIEATILAKIGQATDHLFDSEWEEAKATLQSVEKMPGADRAKDAAKTAKGLVDLLEKAVELRRKNESSPDGAAKDRLITQAAKAAGTAMNAEHKAEFDLKELVREREGVSRNPPYVKEDYVSLEKVFQAAIFLETQIACAEMSLEETRAYSDPIVQRKQQQQAVAEQAYNRAASLPGAGLFIEQLRDENERKRADAARSLGRMGPAAKEAVPDLIQALTDESDSVRLAALFALRDIGPAAKPAVSAINKGVADGTLSKTWAEQALEKITQQ